MFNIKKERTKVLILIRLYRRLKVYCLTLSEGSGTHAWTSLHSFYHVQHAFLSWHLIIEGLSSTFSEFVHEIDASREENYINYLFGAGFLHEFLDCFCSWDCHSRFLGGALSGAERLEELFFVVHFVLCLLMWNITSNLFVIINQWC